MREREPMDRAAYLGAVARALGGPASTDAEGTLRELATHLDDQVADLVAAGEDPSDAERLALRGMGDPGRLGRDLARARRTRRTALALAGGGAFSFTFLSVAAFALTTVAFSALAGFTLTIGGLAIATSWPATPYAYPAVAAGMVAGAWGARAAVSNLIVRAPWPPRTVRLAAAIAILVVGLPVAALVPDLPLDDKSALLVLLVPAVAAASALAAPDRDTLAPGRRTAAVLAGVLLAPTLLWTSATSGITVPSFESVDQGVVARSMEATAAAGIALPTSYSGGAAGTDTGVVITDRYDDLAGWHDLVHEIWALRQRPDGSWALDPEPLVRAPFELNGLDARTTYTAPTPHERTWLVETDTGIAPDGVRSLIGRFAPDLTDPWRGSVLEWFAGR